MKGYVKWWHSERGYGFIVGDDDLDYFVHYSEIQPTSSGRRDLIPYDKVEFESEANAKGLKAVRVRKLIE